MNGQNPDNDKQYHVFFDLISAHLSGESRHPQIVMKELSRQFDFTILDAVPQSLFDGWSFWIEFNREPKDLPPQYFREGVGWISIGTV